ncbi:enoyl-CoA hydratase/isomerase family protein [Desulfococcaceae bacterium HSG9]|nr:enoyl-CoA hydratase/isomerase family protein [Desulfococcaceae bacterium HSG9]
MEESTVLYHKKENVGIITLNRPERLNAITDDLLCHFIEKIGVAKHDQEVASVILTGAGRAFCAGEDLKETSLGKTSEQWVREIDGLQEIQRAILGLGKPLIAVVRGYAVGGGLEFALSCDIRIAAQDAKFGFPETGIGLTVTTAGTKLITQIVGLGKAKEMIFTGEFIDAAEALKIGLVNKVVPEEQLLEEALNMCRKINSHSALALRLSRIAIDQGLHSSFEQTLEIEAAHLLACVNSQEQQDLVEQKLKTMQEK